MWEYFVGCSEIAVGTFDHRHGMVLDVLGVPSSYMGDVRAFRATKKSPLKLVNFLVRVEFLLVSARKRARAALQFFGFFCLENGVFFTK